MSEATKHRYEELIETQKELSELVAPSGREGPVRDYLYSRLEGVADEVSVDGAGNLIAVLEGKAGRGEAGRGVSGKNASGRGEDGRKTSDSEASDQRILLTAHMDEVGFMVSHIESSGFLRVASLGAIDPLLLSGTPVQFLGLSGRPVEGVFTSVPPHVKKKSEGASVPQIEELAVDLGLSSAEEAEELGLSIGSVGTFLSPFRRLEGEAIMGKAFDDRSGCTIALHTALAWAEDRPRNTLVVIFTTGEEHSHLGARAAALSERADVVLALENTTTTDTPGVPEHQVITKLGAGPALTVADKSYIVPESLLDALKGTARRHGISWQYKKPIYGSTDAGSFAVLGGGTPTALVSVPCRYLHAPAGLSYSPDLADSYELTYHFCREYEGTSV